jgi:hypothetical protein
MLNIGASLFYAHATMSVFQMLMMRSPTAPPINFFDLDRSLPALYILSITGTVALAVFSSLTFAVNYAFVEALTSDKSTAKKAAAVFALITALLILTAAIYCAVAILNPAYLQKLESRLGL